MGLGRMIMRLALRDAIGAVAEADAEARKRNPTWYWFTRGLVLVILLVGWLFIFWQNRFHLDAPVVVICLGYFAVVMALANLYRVGAAAVEPDNAGEQAWSRPLGARGELEKEKKTLLKAIKEAEFDHEMGKLSKDDADQLIRMYRARAIELIKELDRLDAAEVGKPQSAREAIEREVAARLAVEEGKGKKKTKQKADGKKPAPGAKPEVKPQDKPEDAPEGENGTVPISADDSEAEAKKATVPISGDGSGETGTVPISDAAKAGSS